MDHFRPALVLTAFAVLAGCTGSPGTGAATAGSVAVVSDDDDTGGTGGETTPAVAGSPKASASPTGTTSPTVPPRTDEERVQAVFEAPGRWVLAAGEVAGAAWPDPSGPIPASAFTISATMVDDLTDQGRVDGPRVFALSYSTSCNGGNVLVTGPPEDLDLQHGFSTMMLCPDEGDASNQGERDFVTALVGGPRTAERRGDVLVLRDDGDVRLEFHQGAPPDWADTTWDVDVVWEPTDRGTIGEAAAARDASIRFEADGTITGSTGCAPVTGRWSHDLWRIDPPDPDADCPADLSTQHAVLSRLLPWATDPTIEADATGFRIAAWGDLDGMVATFLDPARDHPLASAGRLVLEEVVVGDRVLAVATPGGSEDPANSLPFGYGTRPELVAGPRPPGDSPIDVELQTPCGPAALAATFADPGDDAGPVRFTVDGPGACRGDQAPWLPTVLDGLRAVRQVERTGDRLVLTGPDVRLTFVEHP